MRQERLYTLGQDSRSNSHTQAEPSAGPGYIQPVHTLLPPPMDDWINASIEGTMPEAPAYLTMHIGIAKLEWKLVKFILPPQDLTEVVGHFVSLALHSCLSTVHCPLSTVH